MHRYEDRMRAVALYIKFGKRAQATIREQGYPSKNTLRCWYREYERGQELPIGSAPRPPKFSEDQKQVALEHYGSNGRCISWTMRALGYSGRAILTAWVRAAFPETKTVSGMTCGRGEHSATVKQAAVVGLYCREESAEALSLSFKGEGDIMRIALVSLGLFLACQSVSAQTLTGEALKKEIADNSYFLPGAILPAPIGAINAIMFFRSDGVLEIAEFQRSGVTFLFSWWVTGDMLCTSVHGNCYNMTLRDELGRNLINSLGTEFLRIHKF